MRKHRRWMKGVLALMMAMLMIVGPGVTSPAAFAETAESAPPADLSIVTKYVTLTYPADYAAEVVIDVEDAETGCAVTARTDIENTTLDLFTILMTETSSEGFRLGALKTADGGTIGVYLLMNEQRADYWSEESFDKINRLQESINFLLMQLHENKDFVAGG